MSKNTQFPPVHLWLMRHPESLRNAGMDAARWGDRRLFTEACKVSNVNCPLSSVGRSQAMIIGSKLKAQSIKIDRVYISDFLRTHEPLKFLLRPPFPEIIRDSRLNERSHGISEDMTHAEFTHYIKTHPNECASYWNRIFRFAFSEGESFLDLHSRAHYWYREFLLTGGACSLVISHTDVKRILMMIIEGWSEKRFETMLRRGNLKINNGDIHHYSRKNPWNGTLSETYHFVRRWSPITSNGFSSWKIF